MAKLSNKIRRQTSNENPKLTILLEDLFGKPVEDGVLREQIAQDVIDRITERTENSLFLKTKDSTRKLKKGEIDDRSARRYTEKYKSSFEFRVFGKSPRRVNLRATGNMLRSMDIAESEPTKIEIAFDDSFDAKKAHSHIEGTNGKVRDFFGLPETDMQRIRSRYIDQVNAQDSVVTAGTQRQEGESNLDFLIRILGATQTDG